MVAILSSAADPSDLINISDGSTPYRFGQIFRAEGFGAKRLEKKRLMLIKELDPQIERLLLEGERVQFVSWGVEHSLVERVFMGISAFLVNRRALIFSDRRILIIQISPRRKVLRLKAQLRYEAIEKLAKTTFVSIALVLRNQTTLSITGIPRKDRSAIRALVSGKLSATRTNSPVLTGIENLCPKCGYRVRDFPERCKQCAQPFKSGSRAGWLSLAFPGLGNVYLGHRWLGIVEILAASVTWIGFAALIVWLATTQTPPWLELAGLAGLIFAFVHGTDCWITRRIGFKGIYPAN